MPRPSNYRRSDAKPGKHVYHDLPQDVKIAREINGRWPPGKNISKVHESPNIYTARSPRLSTSPSTNSPISKEPARSMKTDRKRYLGKPSEEKESTANLKEMIESSIRTAMLSVADERRSRKKGRHGETKMVKKESRKGRSRHKGFVRKDQDKVPLCHRSRSVYTRSHPTKRQEKSWKSVDRDKHSKNRSKSESLITDNRQMTGNVNIFICSEATDGSQARNKPTDPRPSTESRETSSFSATEVSNSQGGKSTTSSSILESDRIEPKTDTQSSQHYKSSENTGSDISSPTTPPNPTEDSNYSKQLRLGSKISANDKQKEPMESTQSMANVDGPNARSLGRYRSGIDRSDLSFFNSRFARDNERPWNIIPSRNLANSATSEPPSLKSANAEASVPQRNQRSPDWRRRRDSPHKICCTRDKKLVLSRTDECTRRHCKRKFIPCPFLGPEKRPLLCSACNRCSVHEDSLDFIENTGNYCRELQARTSADICNKGDVNNCGKMKKSERLPEEHVTSIVEYAGDTGRVETGVIADTKHLDSSKSRTNEERRVRETSAIDKLIDVKGVNDIQQDAPAKVTSVKQATDASENEKNIKLDQATVKSDEVDVKLTALVQASPKETPKKDDQVPKKPEPPPQPPRVEIPPNHPAKQKLLKLAGVIDRKSPAQSPRTKPEIPKPTGRPTSRKVVQVKLSPVKHKDPRKDRLTTGPLKKEEKQVGPKVMKESAKRFVRTKTGIPKASGTRGRRNDIRQNKQMQSQLAASTKNMQSKQTLNESGSQAVRPKSFKERLRDSLFCRTMMKVLNRLRCRSKKESRKGGSREKSSMGSAVTEEDNRAEKSDVNSQSRIRASRQDRRQVRSVVRRPAVSRPADNKKHTAVAGFPVKKQKTPEDKKDAPSDVTATDNLTIVNGVIEKGKKKADPNSRRPAKPKLLSAIATKRTSLSTGQPVHPLSRKIRDEEKPLEPESPRVDEVSKDSRFVRIEEEKMKDAPINDTKSQEPDSQTPTPKDLPESSQIEQAKVPRVSEQAKSIVDPKMETKRLSVVAKDKIESESVEIRVPQSGAKVDTVGTNAPAATQVPPPTTRILIEREVIPSESICDPSKCTHYPKSCLKRSKKLSSTGHPREFHDCDCRMGNAYLERRLRLDTRCECGGCHKREGNQRHEGALNYGDSIARRERHRCRRTLVCLYCDRPRNNCICRTPARLCACCKLSDGPCKCQDQEQCYHRRTPAPNEATFTKLNREPHHSKRNTSQYEPGISEECRCHETTKYHQSNNSPHEQSSQDYNKPNSLEHDITKERLCQICGEAPCTCECGVKVDDRSKGQKNPRDTINSEAQTLDNEIPNRCKCDYCLLSSDRKRPRAQHMKQRKSKCYYSESSVCA